MASCSALFLLQSLVIKAEKKTKLDSKYLGGKRFQCHSSLFLFLACRLAERWLNKYIVYCGVLSRGCK